MTAEPTGPDLARQALASWKAAAKSRPPTGATKARKKGKRAQYSDGRDPKPVADVLERLAVEYNWRRPSAAGQLMARWEQVAPQGLAALASPERYDPDTRTLHLVAASYPAAAKLRPTAPQIAAALNKAVGVDTVAVVRVLQPGSARHRPTEPFPEEAAAAPPPLPPPPVPPSAGYQAALAAHQAHAASLPATEMQQRIKAAAVAHTEALRAKREDLEAHRDAVWFTSDLEEAAAKEREKTRQAAIRRARDQKAGHGPDLPTVFQRTA